MPVPLAAKGTYELHHVASFVHRFLSVAVDVARAFDHPAICCLLLSLPLPLLLCIVISHAVEAALAGAGSHVPWFPWHGPQ